MTPNFYCILILGIATTTSSGFASGTAEKVGSIRLEWISKERVYKRGIIELKFKLVNRGDRAITLKNWILPLDEFYVLSNVDIAVLSPEDSPRDFLRYGVVTGTAAGVDSILNAGEAREVDAVMFLDLPDGKYVIQGILRSEIGAKSTPIEIEVKGGEVEFGAMRQK